MSAQHHWDNCDLCGRMVVCGKCGNNCCNGGYGTVDGAQCDACPSAYALQGAGESLAGQVSAEFAEQQLRAG